MELKNIFLYGMSGAGKDTISDYLRDEYGYSKFRAAGTIKQFVMETYGFKNQEKFEANKRSNPEVRKAHTTFGDYYDKVGIERSGEQSSINRLKQIANKSSMEFEISSDLKNYPICIVDVRRPEEAITLLNEGFLGIILTRRNKSEFSEATHRTELGMLENNQILELPHPENIFIIRNHDNAENDTFGKFFNSDGKVIFKTLRTDGSNEELLETVDLLFSDYYKNHS